MFGEQSRSAIVAAFVVVATLLLAAGYWLAGLQSRSDDSIVETQMPGTIVAVVDYQRVLQNAEATKDIRRQIDAIRHDVKEEIAAEEAGLHAKDVALGEKRNDLTSEEFSAMRQELEAEVARVQRLAQDRTRALDQASSQALGRVREEIVAILEGIADENEFNLVLPSDTVLLFSPQIDLTEEVLKRLDERLSTVEVGGKTP